MKYLLLPLIFFIARISFAQVSVLTHHNNNMRTGWNPNESILNISNVDTAHFGKLCERLVDDEVYAQPLVVANVNLTGFGLHNVLYIATMNNSVYAYDADERMVVNPYWTVNLTPAGARPILALDYSQAGACGGDYRDFSGNIGIVSTPCIDTASNTIYVVSKNKVMLTGEYQQWLHALDLRNGSEKPNSPVKIEASMRGHGIGSVNDSMYFEAFYENQRSALLLSNGVVYITWAGYCDFPPYNGWVLGYDAQSLQRVVTWSTCADGWAGGVWMSGGGISADEQGNLYLCTGNGSVGDSGNADDVSNRGQSMMKLSRVGNTLEVASYFTPYNWQFMNDFDLDMGTCAVMLLPGTDMAITSGKEGILYVADRDSMGGVDTVDHVRQKISVGETETNVGPVYWDSDSGSYLYIWPASEQPLLRYQIDYTTGKLSTVGVQQSLMTDDFKPAGILSLSSNGGDIGSGIVWANVPLDWATPGISNRPGILRAFDASDLTHELWNSEMNKVRDSIGNYPKFVPPTVVNGRVYMSTFGGRVYMYGIYNPDYVAEIKSIRPLVYPNPFIDKVNINLQKQVQDVEVSIMNTVGQTVFQVNTKFSQFLTLDLGQLSRGVYFLKIEYGASVWTTKILKTQ